ncbi:hypothetical protein DBY68_021785 [Pseudocitrobacter sp. RIT415]|nr:hypothetical protein DBY68_021785 [Pseudocitrobacter sp. RIT 415]
MFTSLKRSFREQTIIIASIPRFLTSKFKQIAQLESEKFEKTAVRKKDLKRPCAKKQTPYNAPPSTRRM